MRIIRMQSSKLFPGLALIFTFGLALFAAPPSQAQTFTVLYAFTGPPDGANPLGSLLLDSTGNLYGTTQQGGVITPNCDSGCGTAFKMDSSGQETVLYSFTGGTDGQSPEAGLILDPMGNLYGTTVYGGTSDYGTLFKISAIGQETVLHSFAGIDGAYPESGLVQDVAGYLYGTTFEGGSGSAGSCTFGCGTVFMSNKTGFTNVLHNFAGYPTDGKGSEAGLLANAGIGYGTTYSGGSSNYGTVFRISTSGSETVLHSFTGIDGAFPSAALIRDAAGHLYGTTSAGGAYGYGAFFEIGSMEVVLYSFTGGADGAYPSGGLVRGGGHTLYGTTYGGGNSTNAGTVFQISSNGHETIVYSFCSQTSCADGAYPSGGLVRDLAGNLYGTTTQGGVVTSECPAGCGVVFKITP